jgi:hypothetical protein
MMMTTITVYARAKGGCERDSLYGREWEPVGEFGPHERGDIADMLREWDEEDRQAFRYVPTEYKID